MKTSALSGLMHKSAVDWGSLAVMLGPLLAGGVAGGVGGRYLTRKSKSKLGKILGPVLGALGGTYAGMVGSTALSQYLTNRFLKNFGQSQDTPQWLKNRQKNISLQVDYVPSTAVNKETGAEIELPEDYLDMRRRKNTAEYNNWMALFGPKNKEKYSLPDESSEWNPLFFDALAGLKLDKIEKIPAVAERIKEEQDKAAKIEERLAETAGMSFEDEQKYRYPFGKDKSSGRSEMFQPPVTARQAIDAKILRDLVAQ